MVSLAVSYSHLLLHCKCVHLENIGALSYEDLIKDIIHHITSSNPFH